MSIQTHCSRLFTLLKQILSDIHDTRISVVSFSSKPQFDFFFILVLSHHIVENKQICFPRVSDEVFVLVRYSSIKLDFLSFLQLAVGRLPFFITLHDLMWWNVEHQFFVFDEFLDKFGLARLRWTADVKITWMLKQQPSCIC